MRIRRYESSAVHDQPQRCERLRAMVRDLAEPRDIVAQPEANRRARERIADRLRDLNYDVRLQGPFANVVAIPRTSAPVTLVGAHYDSVPFSPGADDNASAVAVMLEAARAQIDAPIGFVAFNSEERGIAGSADFVAAVDRAVAGIHVLEMVGYTSEEQQLPPLPIRTDLDRGDFLGVIANQRSRKLLRSVIDAHGDGCPHVATFQGYLGSERLVPDVYRSDHAPFWRAGMPAVMWTDTAEFRNPHYHQPTDTPETLDYQFMAAVCTLLEATLAPS